MTFAQLQAYAERLCVLEGWAAATAYPDWGELVNKALAEFSWAGEYYFDQGTITTEASEPEYSLDTTGLQPWKRITDVLYDGNQIYPVTLVQVRLMNPTWMLEPSGTPQYWWLSRPNLLRLYPAPSSASVSVTIYGYRCEPVLTEADDEPVAPSVYHNDIARIAAALHGETYATSPEQMAKVQQWHIDGAQAALGCRATMGEQEAPLRVSRTVIPRSRRMSL